MPAGQTFQKRGSRGPEESGQVGVLEVMVDCRPNEETGHYLAVKAPHVYRAMDHTEGKL